MNLNFFKFCSSVYTNLEKEQTEIYKFQKYSVIEEFQHKPILAPPFSLFIYLYAFFFYLFCKKYKVAGLTGNAKDNAKRFYNLISNWTTDEYHFYGLIIKILLKLD